LKLKNYEESAIKYRDAKISNDKSLMIASDWDLKNGADAKVLTEQWGKFVSSRKHIKFDFRDLVCSCIGRNKQITEPIGSKQLPKVANSTALVRCPHCNVVVKESRLRAHIHKCHTNVMTSSVDLEDVQREIYGDW
jgi:hypothetical protein